jgi:hypothetical protein
MNPFTALPLHMLRAELSPKEEDFFVMLDSELEKIETFYIAREGEMQASSNMLSYNLEELLGHNKEFDRRFVKVHNLVTITLLTSVEL